MILLNIVSTIAYILGCAIYFSSKEGKSISSSDKVLYLIPGSVVVFIFSPIVLFVGIIFTLYSFVKFLFQQEKILNYKNYNNN